VAAGIVTDVELGLPRREERAGRKFRGVNCLGGAEKGAGFVRAAGMPPATAGRMPAATIVCFRARMEAIIIACPHGFFRVFGQAMTMNHESEIVNC
jgi:hypothetical protein